MKREINAELLDEWATMVHEKMDAAMDRKDSAGSEERYQLNGYISGIAESLAVFSALENGKLAKGYEKAVSEIEKLDGQGKLLKLPCAVGDTVYVPDKHLNMIFESEIVMIEIYKDEIVFIDDLADRYHIEDFNKILFLTSQYAENALKIES